MNYKSAYTHPDPLEKKLQDNILNSGSSQRILGILLCLASIFITLHEAVLIAVVTFIGGLLLYAAGVIICYLARIESRLCDKEK